VRGGGHKEIKNEGVYGGCIFYPYMKIENNNNNLLNKNKNNDLLQTT
jgi:hypothetical protein